MLSFVVFDCQLLFDACRLLAVICYSMVVVGVHCYVAMCCVLCVG